MDYSNTIVNLTFEIGDTTKTVNVPITTDCETEGSENFNIILRRFDTNVRQLQPFRSVGTITDTGTLVHTMPCFVKILGEVLAVPLITIFKFKLHGSRLQIKKILTIYQCHLYFA